LNLINIQNKSSKISLIGQL